MDIKSIWNNRGKILEGFRNKIFKDEHIEAIANERYKVCLACEHIDKEGSKCAVPFTNPCCSKCGCSLGLKTRSLSSECPVDKWSALLTEEEEYKFLNSIYNDKK